MSAAEPGTAEKLAHKANLIARFFASQPHADAVAATMGSWRFIIIQTIRPMPFWTPAGLAWSRWRAPPLSSCDWQNPRKTDRTSVFRFHGTMRGPTH